MIARADYVGPITKSAEAMFARAERQARRGSGGPNANRRTPPSPIRETLHAVGLGIAVLRHWEEAGVIAFERRAGRRVIDDNALRRLRAVVQLRRAGFSVRQITWLSLDAPPSLAQLQKALDDRLKQAAASREAASRKMGAAPDLDGLQPLPDGSDIFIHLNDLPDRDALRQSRGGGGEMKCRL